MNIKNKLKLMKDIEAVNRQHVEDWKEHNSMNRITGVLLDAKNHWAGEKTIDKALSGYYAAVNCSCIDIVTRKIGGKPFCIVCDDEALLKDDPTASMVDWSGNVMLCNNLFVVKSDGRYDVTSLTAEEIKHVLKYIRSVYNRRTKKEQCVLVGDTF